MRPLLVILGVVLFVWLSRKKGEDRLARDVQSHLSFLFRDHGARIIPNDRARLPPPAFDYAFVTVALDDVFIRLCRGRGEVYVAIASKFAPSQWRRLTSVMNLLPLLNEPEHIREGNFRDLWEVSRILRRELQDPEQFRQLKQRLES